MTHPTPVIREELVASALADAILLLSRGYPRKRVMELVRARYALNTWEFLAVYRCAHDPLTSRRVRTATRCIPGANYAIDGYNAAVSLYCIDNDIPLVLCPDGYIRDIMGGWKPRHDVVAELLTDYIEAVRRHLKPSRLIVYLDSRVSRSGEVKATLVRSGVLAATSKTTDKSIVEAARRRDYTPITGDIVILEAVGGCNHLTHYAILRGARLLNLGEHVMREHVEVYAGVAGFRPLRV